MNLTRPQEFAPPASFLLVFHFGVTDGSIHLNDHPCPGASVFFPYSVYLLYIITSRGKLFLHCINEVPVRIAQGVCFGSRFWRVLGLMCLHGTS